MKTKLSASKYRRFTGLALLGVLLSSGCAKFTTERGVENTWRSAETPVFVVGESTQSDVLGALGPPSQIISLKKGSVFYYLREQGKGKGLILLVYNQVKYEVSYDRAVFFFDDDSKLTTYSYSHEDQPEVK